MAAPKRIFLDANILFSAAKSDGAIRALVFDLHQEGIALVVDAYVSAEARRNVSMKADAASLAYLEALLAQIEAVATGGEAFTAPAMSDLLAWFPEKDRPVLRAAITSGCDALVTGDRKDFGAGFGKDFADVVICSPAQLALAVWGAAGSKLP